MRVYKKLESSFSSIEALAPKFLQEDTLERLKFEANSFPTKELAFDLTFVHYGGGRTHSHKRWG